MNSIPEQDRNETINVSKEIKKNKIIRRTRDWNKREWKLSRKLLGWNIYTVHTYIIAEAKAKWEENSLLNNSKVTLVIYLQVVNTTAIVCEIYHGNFHTNMYRYIVNWSTQHLVSFICHRQFLQHVPCSRLYYIRIFCIIFSWAHLKRISKGTAWVHVS